MEKIVNLHLKLIDQDTNEPIFGDQYKVNIYDRDFFKDDLLGSDTPDPLGHVIVSVSQSDYKTFYSPFEGYPDIYFKVFRNGQEIYKSKVQRNVLIEESNVFPIDEGNNFDLGTFIISTELQLK